MQHSCYFFDIGKIFIFLFLISAATKQMKFVRLYICLFMFIQC